MKKNTENTDHKTNPWNQIPLDDYERHMSDISVGQLHLF